MKSLKSHSEINWPLVFSFQFFTLVSTTLALPLITFCASLYDGHRWFGWFFIDRICRIAQWAKQKNYVQKLRQPLFGTRVASEIWDRWNPGLIPWSGFVMKLFIFKKWVGWKTPKAKLLIQLIFHWSNCTVSQTEELVQKLIGVKFFPYFCVCLACEFQF